MIFQEMTDSIQVSKLTFGMMKRKQKKMRMKRKRELTRKKKKKFKRENTKNPSWQL